MFFILLRSSTGHYSLKSWISLQVTNLRLFQSLISWDCFSFIQTLNQFNLQSHMKFFINKIFLIDFLEPSTCQSYFICISLMSIFGVIIKESLLHKIRQVHRKESTCISLWKEAFWVHIKVFTEWKYKLKNLFIWTVQFLVLFQLLSFLDLFGEYMGLKDLSFIWLLRLVLSLILKQSIIFSITDWEDKRKKMGNMRKLRFDILGTPLIESQITCFTSCKDIQIIMRIALNLIKH